MLHSLPKKCHVSLSESTDFCLCDGCITAMEAFPYTMEKYTPPYAAKTNLAELHRNRLSWPTRFSCRMLVTLDVSHIHVLVARWSRLLDIFLSLGMTILETTKHLKHQSYRRPVGARNVLKGRGENQSNGNQVSGYLLLPRWENGTGRWKRRWWMNICGASVRNQPEAC